MQLLNAREVGVADAKRVIRGLYAVTPEEHDTVRLCGMVQAVIAGGASLVQYRSKSGDASRRRGQAHALLSVCRARKVPMIVNDDLDLAVEIDADGVHVGRDDGTIEAARARLGADRIVGASCYDQLGAAIAAQQAGATYVAFGSFFPSRVKPAAVAAPLQLLREAKARLKVPLVAIGGITSANAAQLIAAGADSVAVISALFSVRDVETAAREIAELFSSRP